METNLITMEDMDYLAGQSADSMNMILSGMTALLDENNEKAEMLGSQTWFQRMSRTITGKNKMTQAEIQQNHDKINMYVTQAMAELFERNCIDQQIIMSLGTCLNELYADHIQLKQMLGAFADKLNQKLVSIDSFHMLETEIEQGVYDGLMPVAAMCKVLSQLDIRTLNDGRKLDILERGLRERGIISGEPVGIMEYLMGLLNTAGSEIGVIYMELGNQQDNFIASIFKEAIESYHFLPATVKMMKKKELVVESIIQQNQLDDSAALALEDIYHEFLDAKIMAAPKIELQEAVSVNGAEASEKLQGGLEAFLKCDKEGIENLLEPLAEQEDGLALYLMSFLNYLQTDTREKDFLERGHIAGNPMASMRYAEKCKGKNKGNKIVQYHMDELKDMAAQGNMFAQYEYAMLFSEQSKLKIQQDEAVDIRGLLQSSADQGFWVAAYQLAYRCRYGIDGETDYEKAFKLFSKMNQMKVLPGITELADFYMKGIFVEKNEKKAFELYEKADKCGMLEAKCDLARCYQYGMGVYEDREKAKKLYEDYLETAEKDLVNDGLFECSMSNTVMELEGDLNKKKKLKEKRDKIIYSIKVNKTSAEAAYQLRCLELEDSDLKMEAGMYLFVAARCGHPYALYECAKFFATEDSEEYCATYPESPYISYELSGYCLPAEQFPYDLEAAQYYLEQAKKYTDDEALLAKIEWLSVKVTAKGAKDLFTDGKNLLKDILGW